MNDKTRYLSFCIVGPVARAQYLLNVGIVLGEVLRNYSVMLESYTENVKEDLVHYLYAIFREAKISPSPREKDASERFRIIESLTKWTGKDNKIDASEVNSVMEMDDVAVVYYNEVEHPRTMFTNLKDPVASENWKMHICTCMSYRLDLCTLPPREDCLRYLSECCLKDFRINNICGKWLVNNSRHTHYGLPARYMDKFFPKHTSPELFNFVTAEDSEDEAILKIFSTALPDVIQINHINARNWDQK